MKCLVMTTDPVDSSVYIGMGFTYRIRNNVYIVSCLHIVKKNTKSIKVSYRTVSGKQYTISAQVQRTIPEFDLVLMSVKTVDTVIESESISSIELSESTVARYYEFADEELTQIRETSVRISNLRIEENWVRSILAPKLPMIVADVDQTTSADKVNLHGMSGTIIEHDGYKGMVIKRIERNGKECVAAIPLNIVDQILKSHSIVGIIIHTCVCDVLDDAKKFHGHYVTEDTCAYKNVTKDFTFRKGDVITHINDREVDACGKFYSKKLDMQLSLNTYMFLNLLVAKSVQIRYIRNENTYSKNISGISFNNIFRTRITEGKNVMIGGLVFADLSEELILDLREKGIRLTGELTRYDKFDCGQKTVVLIRIDPIAMLPETVKQCFEYRLPYIRNEDGYGLAILEKIGTRNVRSVNDLKSVIGSHRRTRTLTFRESERFQITI